MENIGSVMDGSNGPPSPEYASPVTVVFRADAGEIHRNPKQQYDP